MAENRIRKAALASIVAMATATGVVLVNTNTGEVTPYEAVPDPVFYTLKQCKQQGNQSETKAERVQWREHCNTSADPVTNLVAEKDMPITIKNGEAITPGETVDVVADNAAEWTPPSGQEPGVQLTDPADPGNVIVLPVTDTGDAATKQVEVPSDMGGIGFTEPGAPAGAQVVFTTPAATTAGLYPGTNIRWQRSIGTRSSAIKRWSDITPTWFSDNYVSSGMKYVRDNAPLAFTDAKAGLVMNIRWRDFYVDETLAPTSRAQAQDPTWSNYIWNTDDRIAQQLLSPEIVSGEAVLRLLLQMEATSIRLTHPQWMLDTPNATWTENGDMHRTTPNFFFQTADAIIAVVKQYGNSGIDSILLGEYYMGSQSAFPAGVNRNNFLTRREEIWADVAANVPLDGNGNQIAILQKSFAPPSNDAIGPDALYSRKIGYSQSDVRTFGFEGTTMAMQGNAPTDIGGDTRFAQYWAAGENRGLCTVPDPAPANPFGFTANQSIQSPPDVIGWFASSTLTGAHLDSIYLRMDPKTVQNKENFAAMLNQYGTGGTALSATQLPVPVVR